MKQSDEEGSEVFWCCTKGCIHNRLSIRPSTARTPAIPSSIASPAPSASLSLMRLTRSCVVTPMLFESGAYAEADPLAPPLIPAEDEPGPPLSPGSGPYPSCSCNTLPSAMRGPPAAERDDEEDDDDDDIDVGPPFLDRLPPPAPAPIPPPNAAAMGHCPKASSQSSTFWNATSLLSYVKCSRALSRTFAANAHETKSRQRNAGKETFSESELYKDESFVAGVGPIPVDEELLDPQTRVWTLRKVPRFADASATGCVAISKSKKLRFSVRRTPLSTRPFARRSRTCLS